MSGNFNVVRDSPIGACLLRTRRLNGRPWMVDPALAQTLIAMGVAGIVRVHPHHVELSLTNSGIALVKALG